ncbi:MAG: hypothetical protein JWM95_4067 [Gemmatimonadetes bacterium]|nr:hypothetical protein [Gemmatimonadota bacterium]
MSAPRDRARNSGGRVELWTALILLLAAAVAYGPALSAPFIFDDVPSIQNNTSLRTLWPPGIALRPPGRGTALSGRPISNYSFALSAAANRWIGITPGSDKETRIYHITNVMLHVCSAFLLCGIVGRTLRTKGVSSKWRESAPGIAATIAALWMLHPLQTEAVNYLSQRTELLVSFFYLAVLYSAMRAWESEGWSAWSVVAVVASALGMASKEVMLTAPIAVVLYDKAFFVDAFKSPARRRLYAALFATMAIAVALIVRGGRSATVGFSGSITWYEYLYSQGWAISRYLLLALWPADLVIDYGRNGVRDSSGVPGVILLSVLLAFTLWAWRHTRLRWLAFLCSWFFLTLAPSSSIVPIVTEIAAERRVYLALASVIIVLVIGAEFLFRRASPPRHLRFVLVGVVSLCMVAATASRSQLYNDPEALWKDAVNKRPGTARAYEGLASVILNKDTTRLREADELLSRAIALDSSAPAPFVSRAAIALKRRDFAAAEAFLGYALRVAPDDSAANQAFGETMSASSHSERAIVYLKRIADAAPSGASLQKLGTAYLISGRLDSAHSILARAVQLDSTNNLANQYLGATLVEMGRGEDAIAPLTRSMKIDSASGFTLSLLAVAYAESKRPELAMKAAGAAVALASRDAQTWAFAGRAAQYAGQYAQAVAYLKHAVRLDSADLEAPTRLAFVLGSTGHFADGVRILEQVLVKSPGYEPATLALARLREKSGAAP